MLCFEDFLKKREKIAVVGLGYVGLPLAVALARHFSVLGFDISQERINELSRGQDRTREVDAVELSKVRIDYSAQPTILSQARLLVVAVPTPIDKNRRPDLGPTAQASKLVGQYLRPGSVVVYESTVYPGLTEEFCIPLLEETSGLRAGEDFWVGYSPERINPGDRVHTLENIVKIVSGQTPEVLELLAQVYGQVVRAGVHRAPNIKVAEAAKVIENTQRDLNIALMNELSLIFQRLGIDTLDVLEAAGTKWNFLPFRPGLVGGHCIGVDPYYLTFKAEALNYHPQVILAGRRINDSMGEYVAQQVVKKLIQLGKAINGARVGILGLTFKENVPDLRNTKVIDIIKELETFCVEVLVHDPLADPQEASRFFDLDLVSLDDFKELDGLVLAVPHQAYGQLAPEQYFAFFKDQGQVLFADIKGLYDSTKFMDSRVHYWRL